MSFNPACTLAFLLCLTGFRFADAARSLAEERVKLNLGSTAPLENCPSSWTNGALDACLLTNGTATGGGCALRAGQVLVKATPLHTFPGGLGSWGCDCQALYTFEGHRDVLACTACKVCGLLQAGTAEGRFRPSGYSCSAKSNSTCAAPLPLGGRPSPDYTVLCSSTGPQILPALDTVTVPPDVWTAIKDAQC